MSHAALYCIAAGLFCVFFTLIFGPAVGNAWVVAALITTATGMLVVQPLTVLVKAFLAHFVVWNFATVTSVHGADIALFAGGFMGAMGGHGYRGGTGGQGGLQFKLPS